MSELNLASTRTGLVFDADATTLIGHFSDELTCYRTRRTWIEVLNNYFLLERDRDYKLEITSNEEGRKEYVLNCGFISACGRYAFWRLINNQAIDAERDLTMSSPVKRHRAKGLSWDDEDADFEDSISFPSLLNQELRRGKSWYEKLMDRLGVKTRD